MAVQLGITFKIYKCLFNIWHYQAIKPQTSMHFARGSALRFHQQKQTKKNAQRWKHEKFMNPILSPSSCAPTELSNKLPISSPENRNYEYISSLYISRRFGSFLFFFVFYLSVFFYEKRKGTIHSGEGNVTFVKRETKIRKREEKWRKRFALILADQK